METTTLEVAFAADSTEEDGDDLILKGKLFKAGDYPERQFSMTPLELHDTITRFVAPAPMDLHHKPSIFGNVDLRGEFGQIEQVWSDEPGEWIMAKVRKPKWLQKVMPETRVSATFAREDKSLVAAAWTHSPVVPDAQLEAELVAAFAGTRHNTQNGQMALQQVHDVAARSGAVCDKTAAMASRHESKGIQRVHDTAVSHGAVCQSIPAGQSLPTYFSKPTPSARSARMNLKEFLLGQAKEQNVELDHDEVEAAFSAAPEVEKLKAEIEANKKALADREAELASFRTSHESTAAAFARIAEDKRQGEAVTFANAQVHAHRLTPASAEKLAPLVARISASDSTANFAEGDTPTMKLLEELVESFPDLSVFTAPSVKDETLAALFSQSTTKGVKGPNTSEVNAENVEAMKKATAVGRQTLKKAPTA